MSKYRSNNCGELNLTNIDQEVVLSGWINKKGIMEDYCLLTRDHYGLTQCVFDSQIKNFRLIGSIKLESVIKVEGKVVKRSDETINSSLTTGEIEILIERFEILNSSKQIPFQVSVDDDSPEDLRLKYRYIDLRRKKFTTT